MANQQRTNTFMQELGLNVPNSPDFGVPGELKAVGSFLGGAIEGVGGLISGEGGRSFKEFGRDFNAGFTDMNDFWIAQERGEPVGLVRKKRQLQQKLMQASTEASSPEEQLQLMQDIAAEANSMGMPGVAFQAAQMKLQLQKQIQDRKSAGIEIEQAEVDLEEDRTLLSIGMEGNLVTSPDVNGKAVRIDRARATQMGLPPEAVGKLLFLDEDGNSSIIDPAEFVKKDTLAQLNTTAKQQTSFQRELNMNGATSSNIPKMRNTLFDMGKQAVVVQDISEMLLSLNDPDKVLAWSGKVASFTDKGVRFIVNAANVLVDADQGVGAHENLGAYRWIGKDGKSRILNGGESERRSLWQEKVNARMADKGWSAVDLLPGHIKDYLVGLGLKTADISRIAEQYKANVMELAYMDARLQEPSNRGLSDKDIENAMARIGAATANPRSFAQRQLRLLERLEDAVAGLGAEMRVSPGNKLVTDEMLREHVYPSQIKADVLTSLASAKDSLNELFAGGRDSPTDFSRVDQIEKRIAEGDTITKEDLDKLDDDEVEELRRRRQENR